MCPAIAPTAQIITNNVRIIPIIISIRVSLEVEVYRNKIPHFWLFVKVILHMVYVSAIVVNIKEI
jgi:hypothetical protein